MSDPSESHFTPAELAEAWQLDKSTIRRIFIDMPGVLKIGRRVARGKRRYVTLRIPREIAERVYRERRR